MRKFKKTMLILSVLSLAALGAGIFTACGEEEYVSDDIVNGSFEYDADGGYIPGWEREDMAFQTIGVTEEQAEELEASGRSYFNGKKSIITNKGTLTSLPFLLSGTGKIAFKLGAAKNPDKVYIEFLDSGKGTPLNFIYDGKEAVKATNTDFDGAFITAQMIRHTADLSAHMGKKIVIRVTDNDAGKNEANYPYANLDDFRLLKDEAEAVQYENERKAQLAKYAAPPFEDDTPDAFTIKNGDFDEGLDQWKITGEAFRPAGVVNSDATYWEGRYFYAHGEKFFRGDLNEGKTGSMRSTTFTLKTGAPYISMMLGAGKSMNAYVEVRLAEDAGDEKKDTVVKKIRNTAFSDPARALMLVRTYAKLDEKYEGKKLYLNVVDNAVNDFGFINIDDIRCSLTEAEVTALITEQFRALDGAPSPSGAYAGDLDNLKNWYLTCEYPAPANFIRLDKRAEDRVLLASEYASPVDLSTLIASGAGGAKATLAGNPIPVKIEEVKKDGVSVTGIDFTNITLECGVYTVKYSTDADESVALNQNVSATVNLIVTEDMRQVYNGGFETGDLTGWTLEFTDGDDWSGNPVQDTDGYWGGKAVYNKSGKYHFNGQEGGIPEGRTFRLTSSSFVLGGSGFISFKLGGHAAVLKVYTVENGVDTQVAEYKNTAYADHDITHVHMGAMQATMTTYVADLSEYLGKELKVVLCDDMTRDWGHAILDEVITYYETAPSAEDRYDTVNNLCDHTPDEMAQIGKTFDIPWRKAENSYRA